MRSGVVAGATVLLARKSRRRLCRIRSCAQRLRDPVNVPEREKLDVKGRTQAVRVAVALFRSWSPRDPVPVIVHATVMGENGHCKINAALFPVSPRLCLCPVFTRPI
jgi:hypothetical protein